MINPKPKPEKKSKIKPKFPKKYKKKTEKGKLEIEADRIIKSIVMIRDGSLCCCPAPKSGHSQVMQAGHLISRTCKSVRWDLWNVHVQCSSCNMRHEHKPELYTKWFIREFGSDAFMELVERSAKVRKIPEHEMRQLCAGLNSVFVAFQLAKEKDKELHNSEKYLTQEQIISIGKIVIPD